MDSLLTNPGKLEEQVIKALNMDLDKWKNGNRDNTTRLMNYFK